MLDDLLPEERDVVIATLRDKLANDRFPFSPRLKPLKSALAKLDPPMLKPSPKPPIAGASEAAIRRRKGRAR